jgi:ABC-type multidrug transport system permease subunit
LLPKVFLALCTGLVSGTVLLFFVYLWLGVWPGGYLPAVWLLAGLVSLFWVPITLLVGLRARYFAGTVASILAGITVFFVAGGLAMVRSNKSAVPIFSWIFPNIYAVDPLRDLILFQAWPSDWSRTLIILAAFALVSLSVGLSLASRQIRRPG